MAFSKHSAGGLTTPAPIWPIPGSLRARPVLIIGSVPPVEVGRGSQFQHLLVTALHRAVALVEVDDLAFGIGQDLDLYVPWPVEGLLQKHGRISESALGLAHRRLDRAFKIFRALDPAHAAPSATGGGLHEHRVAYTLRRFERVPGVGDWLGGSGHGD